LDLAISQNGRNDAQQASDCKRQQKGHAHNSGPNTQPACHLILSERTACEIMHSYLGKSKHHPFGADNIKKAKKKGG
jgi:hypothetical protein